MSRHDVLIVGAGHAGGRLALTLRELGHRGTIGLVGDERWVPYERPPLSKGALKGDAAPPVPELAPREAWRDLAIDLRSGRRVTGIDRPARRVTLSDGESIGYDRLVLATGVRPRTLRVEDNSRSVSLRSYDDAIAMRRRLATVRTIAIAGGGLIGLEIASTVAERGIGVNVVESGEHLLPRWLPAPCAEWLLAWHRERGVGIRLGRQVRRLDAGEIELDDGSRLPAEHLVAAIGSVPNDELALDAGIACNDGVLVDERWCTSDPRIHAIGDVARHERNGIRTPRIESWRNAETHARGLAAVLCGAPVETPAVPWYWTDQCGRNLQIAGWPAEGTTLEIRGDPRSGPCLVWSLDAGVPRGVVGIDCGGDVRRAQGLLATSRAVRASDLFAPRRSSERASAPAEAKAS